MASVYKLASALFDLLGCVEFGAMAKATLWGGLVYLSHFHSYVFFSPVLAWNAVPFTHITPVSGLCTALDCRPSAFALGSQRNSDA